MFYLNDFLSVYFSSHMPPHPAFFCIFTARKQSLRRLCFHKCLPVHRGSLSRGVSVQWGGLCSGGGLCSRGGLCPGGFLPRGSLSSVVVSVRGVSVQGGVSIQEGVFVQEGVSVRETPYVYVRAVRILLECILVNKVILDFVSAITPSE